MTSTLQKSFGSRLIAIARIYRRGVDRELARLGISDAMALPVMVIARGGGGIRLGALADELGLEPPSLLRVVDQLEAKALVRRQTDAADKRAKCLVLTDAGKALADQVEQVMGEVRGRLFDQIDPAELETASRVIERLEHNLRERAR